MNELLTALTHALDASAVLGVAAAVALGVASVLLSPCHLASVPLVVAVVQARDPRQRPLQASARFGIGVLGSFAVVGAVTVGLGRIAGDVGPWATWAAATLLVLFGLETLGAIHLPWLRPATSDPRLRDAHPALLGFAFGATLGPCTFALMAPALGAAFAAADTRPLYAAALVASFSLSHAAVLVIAGTLGEWTFRYLQSRDAARAVSALRTAMGLSLIGAATYLIAFGA